MGVRNVKRAIFFDRDGVINKLVYNPKTVEYESPHVVQDFEMQTGALQALHEIQNMGWKLFLVSNQPSYAKGKTTLEEIQAIHARLHEILTRHEIYFTEYYYCYHHPLGIVPEYSGDCECRKPKPYFVLKAIEQYSLDPQESWLIGDQDSDIYCGKAAGLRTILVTTAHSESKQGKSRPDFTVANLNAAVELLAQHVSLTQK